MKTASKMLVLASVLQIICSTKLLSQNWAQVGSGFNDAVYCLYADTVDSSLYAGGWFTQSGTTPVNNIARWNGTSWDSMGNGSPNCGGAVSNIIRYNGEIYSAGCFFPPSSSGYIAKWNGTSWDSVGKPNGSVLQLTIYNNELYACGYFTDINGIPINNIAKFNGSSWSSVANDTTWNNPGVIIAFYNGELYVGGNFYNLTTGMWRLAKWNGTNWVKVGNSGIYGLSAGVWDMKVFNGELYVAGEFYVADGNVGNYIQKWNGTTWGDVGGGMAGGFAVMKLEENNSKLYAGGVFDYAGGVPAQNIASWDGTNWCGYNTNFNSAVNSFAVLNNEFYVGGGFNLNFTDTLRSVAKWTGGNYTDTCGNTTGITENNFPQNNISIYPNPFNESTTIEISDAVGSPFEFILYDELGRAVKQISQITERKFVVVRENLTSGIYFYTLQTSEKTMLSRGKLVIQ